MFALHLQKDICKGLVEINSRAHPGQLAFPAEAGIFEVVREGNQVMSNGET
jgi:hypothetical protein